MADRDGSQRELVYCHNCENEWLREQHGLECPECHSDVVEIIDERHDPRDNHITIDNLDSDQERSTPNPMPNSTPQHPLHHHNPWRNNAPDPDEQDIEHVEWHPAPNVHMSFHSRTSRHVPRSPADLLGPMFPGFATMFEAAGNAPGRPPGSTTRPEFTPFNSFPHIQYANPHRHGHGHWVPNGTNGGPPNDGPNPFPGPNDANNFHAVFGLLGGMLNEGNGPPGGMPNLHAFISSILRGGMHGDAVYSDEALDRIVTQMMEQHNAHSAPGPASAAAIAALPKQKVAEGMMGSDGKAECSVCMDAVQIGDEVTVLPCKHWFHEDCVGAWLKEHDTCPHCRQGIMPKDAPEDADAPRSPEQAPRNFQDLFRFTNPNQPPAPQSSQPQSLPGAFTQPGMQQPYVPGGFSQYPEPQNYVNSPGPDPQGHVSHPPSQQSRSQQSSPHSHNYHYERRRRSSARERSSGGGGGEGSGGSGQGVTGWLRRLGGSSGGSAER